LENPKNKLPLYVDLDGTLIQSNLLLESFLLLIKKNFFYILLAPFWLLSGRANLKHQVATRVDLQVDVLPYNANFVTYLAQEKTEGRQLILISASNQKLVTQVANHLAFFDEAIGSSATLNLKGKEKLDQIEEFSNPHGFAYAGDSEPDLPIWAAAKEAILVKCSESLRTKIDRSGTEIKVSDQRPPSLKHFIRAIRPHQWLKNLLIFLPLILSHQVNETNLLLQSIVAFVSFSLCASSVYLLNDLLDLNNDRRHPSKHMRPFASGDLSLIFGMLGSPLFLLLAFTVALSLPENFIVTLSIYWLITASYSLYLKRLVVVDVLILASLYCIRVVAGSAAIAVTTTFWLLAFSLLLFISLALVKRVTELNNLRASGEQIVAGRGYTVSHYNLLSGMGIGSSLFAVLLFVFYIRSPDTLVLYSAPNLLYLVCPLLLCIMGRAWLLVRREVLHEDPVIFAITDVPTQVAVALSALVVWLAI
jgi:4-hydroxybenzoate polyprenyltransferase